MDKQKDIPEEVEKTLNAMDSMDRLEAGPFFYVQIQAKMAQRRKAKASRWFPAIHGDTILRPVLLVMLILVNVLSAYFFLAQPPQVTTEVKPLYAYVSSLTQKDYQGNKAYDTIVTNKIIESVETGGEK
jgi:hypothetical protein